MYKKTLNYLKILKLHKKVKISEYKLINKDKIATLSRNLVLGGKWKDLKNNVFLNTEVVDNESVYFKNLLLKEKKAILGLHKKGEKFDKNKMKNMKMETLNPWYGAYKKALILNDSNKVFSSISNIKNKDIKTTNFINIRKDKFRFINLFNKSKILGNIKQIELRNIIEEKYNNVVSRKMENKLKIPHYFFPTPYIARGMTTQLRSWPNTIYSYFKPTMRNVKYLDLLTSKLIKLFFNVISLKRRVVLGNKIENGLDAIAIKPINLFIKYINEIIKFTSFRTQNLLKDILFYSSDILSLPWFKDEIRWAKALKKYIKERRVGKVVGYLPKRRVFFNKARKILLSKPLFRHTAFNVIIDLFVYNNKSYKLGKYHNMIRTRALYKYMYSMYANYWDIIQNIMSRPRLFYINIIDPKVYYYYSNVIHLYEKILIHISKRQFVLLLLSIFKWNLNNKFFTKSNLYFNYFNKFNHTNNSNRELSLPINSVDMCLNNNMNYTTNGSFGKWICIKSSNSNKYINNNIRILRLRNNIYKFRSLYNNQKENVFINDFIFKIKNILPFQRKIRATWGNIEYFLPQRQDVKINKALIRKQYLEEMERKAKTPINLKDYTLWSRKGLGKYIKKDTDKTRRIKIFGKDKFTLKKHIKKLGKGKKWSKLSPKFWEQEILKYNLFGITQKHNTNPNEKWVYDKKTKIKVHIKKYLKDPLIFDKINKKRKKSEGNKKIKNTLFFTKYNKKSNNNTNLLSNSKFNNSQDFKYSKFISNDINSNNKYYKGKEKNKFSDMNNITKFSMSNKNYYINSMNSKRKIYTLIKHKKIFNNNEIINIKLNRVNKKNYINKLEKLFIKDQSKLDWLNHKGLIENKMNKIERLLKYKHWLNKFFISWKTKNSFSHSYKNKQKINYIKYVKDLYYNEKEIKLKKSYLIIKVKEKEKINNSSLVNLNNKILWDKLDYSIIGMIVKLLKNNNYKFIKNNLNVNKDKNIKKHKKINKIKNVNKNNNSTIKFFNRTDSDIIYEFLNYSFSKLARNIKKLLGKNDRWYIDNIKQEFYNINRDVLVSKTLNIINNDTNNFNYSYNYGYYSDNLYNNFNFKLENRKNLYMKIWQSLNFNSREENLINKLRFSDKVFKPYYRYMIRLFIFNEYKLFINKLGYINLLMHFYIPIMFTKFNWFKDNNISIFNFIVVRTLFNLFAFNYRSLFILKPKYYYINKFRYFKRKTRTLNFNTWLKSVKYLKALRKAPNNYWLRFHKLVNFYYTRILNYSKWDTDRKVLLPYVLYFEDLLYNIYGKWALVRIWPLKRYFLSSFILAERLMLLLDTKANYSRRRKSITSLFTRFVFKFINLLNLSKIDKVYEFNLENKSRWPNELINIINKPLSQNWNFNKLEYNSEKFDTSFIFNTYLIKNANLDFYLPIIKNYYFNTTNYFDSKLKRSKKKLFKLNIELKKGFIRYWTRPLKNYILNITNRQDISGVEFRLAGKARSRPRAFSLIYQRGSFLGARHYNSKIHRYLTFSSSYFRNTLKSTMDFTLRAGNFKPGTTTLKLWFASLLSSDVVELLLYLLKMKIIYNALMNRYFIVPSHVKNIITYFKLISPYEFNQYDYNNYTKSYLYRKKLNLSNRKTGKN